MFNKESIFTTARAFDPIQEDKKVSYTSSSLSSLVRDLILTNSFKDLIPKLRDLSTEVSNITSSKDFNANFISDSGATYHIISSLKYFTSFKKLDKKIH